MFQDAFSILLSITLGFAVAVAVVWILVQTGAW
jgi:hypothetical protein